MFRAVCFVGFVLGLGACRSDPAPPRVSLGADVTELVADRPDAAEPENEGCGWSVVGVADATARFEVIGEVIDAIRSGSCAPIAADRRLCRSLFLIGATDPLVGMGVGLDRGQLEQLAEWHHWALADGVVAAGGTGDVAIADALRAIGQLDVGEAVLGADVSMAADLALARADSEIIEPLEAAEEACLSLPR